MTSLKRYVRPAGLILGTAATAAFCWYATRALASEDLSQFLTVRGVAAIVIAALCYTTIIPSTAFAWRMLLRGLGEVSNLRSLTEIIAVSQFAKYIPGNVGVHLGRSAMALARGMNGRKVVMSLLVEGVLAVASALFVGSLGMSVSGIANEALSDRRLGNGIMAATIVVIAIAAAALVARLAPRTLRERLVILQGWPSVRTMLGASFLYTLNYGVIAIGMWAMVTLLFQEQSHNIGTLAAAFALAWVAGFFTPGAPAGIGIRETLMLLLLSFAYAPAQALVIVVAMRIATILADALIFLAGNTALWLSHRASRFSARES